VAQRLQTLRPHVIERKKILAARLCRDSALHLRTPAISDVDVPSGRWSAASGGQLARAIHHADGLLSPQVVAVLPLVSASGELNSQQLNSAPPSFRHLEV
jgi:hypothetical protein